MPEDRFRRAALAVLEAIAVVGLSMAGAGGSLASIPSMALQATNDDRHPAPDEIGPGTRATRAAAKLDDRPQSPPVRIPPTGIPSSA